MGAALGRISKWSLRPLLQFSGSLLTKYLIPSLSRGTVCRPSVYILIGLLKSHDSYSSLLFSSAINPCATEYVNPARFQVWATGPQNTCVISYLELKETLPRERKKTFHNYTVFLLHFGSFKHEFRDCKFFRIFKSLLISFNPCQRHQRKTFPFMQVKNFEASIIALIIIHLK